MYFYDQSVPGEDVATEVKQSLARSPKSIAPKFFYDERGSELFTEITRLPEYYLTRVETGLLRRHADEIASLTGENCQLIEYGSGSSEKIRLLLESLRPSVYAPLDISTEYLAQAANALASEYPWLEVHAVSVDFTDEFTLPFDREGRRVSFFPGSSIGNFSRPEAAAFLKRIRGLVGDDGALLIGVDLKKDEAVLNAAYNDAAGVTAAFNLNVLHHLNSELNADFDVEQFSHVAAYNDDEGCIQMHLRSEVEQTVSLDGQAISFSAGEMIHTENSHKYAVDEFLMMAKDAGFERSQSWLDDDSYFGVFFLSSGGE